MVILVGYEWVILVGFVFEDSALGRVTIASTPFRVRHPSADEAPENLDVRVLRKK